MGKKTAAIAASIIVATLLLNYSSVTAQPQAPALTIDQPPDIVYLAGTTGNSITWHPSSEIPANYTIQVLEWGMLGPPFPAVWHANWTGGSITQNVDGWDEGTFNYTCIVYDTQGRNASSTVTVAIVPEGLQVTLILAGIVAGIGALVAIYIIVEIADRGKQNRSHQFKLL